MVQTAKVGGGADFQDNGDRISGIPNKWKREKREFELKRKLAGIPAKERVPT